MEENYHYTGKCSAHMNILRQEIESHKRNLIKIEKSDEEELEDIMNLKNDDDEEELV